jgi:hypothetical protein
VSGRSHGPSAHVIGLHFGAAPELSVERVLAQRCSRRRGDAVDMLLENKNTFIDL